MKKKLNLVKNKWLTYAASGIGWSVYAFLSLFDNLLCSLLSCIVLLICVAVSIKGPDLHKESDEMSKYNLLKAKASTLDYLEMIICAAFLIIAVVGLLHEFFPIIQENFKVSLAFIVPLIFGTVKIMIGLFLHKYEKYSK